MTRCRCRHVAPPPAAAFACRLLRAIDYAAAELIDAAAAVRHYVMPLMAHAIWRASELMPAMLRVKPYMLCCAIYFDDCRHAACRRAITLRCYACLRRHAMLTATEEALQPGVIQLRRIIE